MKIREAIDKMLAKKANDIATSLTSSLVLMLGRENEVKEIRAKIHRKEKLTDEEGSLITSMMQITGNLVTTCNICAIRSFYSGINSGAVQPTVLKADEELETEISGFDDPRLSTCINKMFGHERH